MKYSTLTVTEPDPQDLIGFEPVMAKDFIDADLLALVNMQLKNIKKDLGKFKHEKVHFNRAEINDHPLFGAIHEIIHERTEKLLSRKLKRTYCFTAIYEPGRGACPKHTDRPECRYSVDLCLNANKPWEFKAQSQSNEELSFLAQPGDAIILSGTHHPHWRPDPLPADQFCDLAFFHFIDA